MRWLAILLCIGFVGCSQCGSEEKGPGRRIDPAKWSAPVEVPKPKTTYQEAIDRAKSEITLDNADERLEKIEREIEQDLESM